MNYKVKLIFWNNYLIRMKNINNKILIIIKKLLLTI